MKIGTICKLKVDCLDNKAGTLGVAFNNYMGGFQVIFENGNYGFSSLPGALVEGSQSESEADHFIEEVGFEESLAGYKFQNVMTVSEDYRQGKFDIAWSEGWKNFVAGRSSVEPKVVDADYFPDEYEKCKVCVEDGKWPWLYFIREKDREAILMLSAAMDYVDFSHFEYADVGESMFPRWKHEGVTMYPQYVVFRKKQ